MAALAAAVKVEQRQVGRWESLVPTAHPGSHELRSLTNHIADTEARLSVQEARLSRMEARNTIINSPSPSAPTAPPIVSAPVNPPLSPPIVARPGKPIPIIVTAPVTFTANAATASQSTGTTNSGTQSSLPANVSQTLDVIYNAYEQDPSGFPSNIPTTNNANLVMVQGSNVGIQVKDSNPANFNTLLSELEGAGMQVTASSAQSGLVVGLLPVAQLPTVAAFSDAPSVAPLFQLSAK
jgi:hypothetical protein